MFSLMNINSTDNYFMFSILKMKISLFFRNHKGSGDSGIKETIPFKVKCGIKSRAL